MRILLINPNTSAEITDLVVEHAAKVAPHVEIVPVTGRFGARYISSRAAAAIAGHAALEILAEHAAGCDAVYLACFGDPGLFALQEISPIPVVGMAEASCRHAAANQGRFSIVTSGACWGPMLREFVATLGLADRLASVRTITSTGGAIARDRQGHLEILTRECRASADEDGANAVVLGGAGLAGLARPIAPRLPIPVICSVEAGMRAALAAASGRDPGLGKPAPMIGVPSVGLSSGLARLLAGSGAISPERM